MTSETDDRDKPSPGWKRPPEPAIHCAARKGNISLLAELVGQGADVNQRADLEFDNGPHLKGLTTLMVAARSIDGANVETLRWLVENGADINARSEGDNTAAWYAAGHGGRWNFHKKEVTPDHVERLRFLLNLGLDPTERNYVGRSLITEACDAGDPARVSLLLERGAQPTAGRVSSPPSALLQRISAALEKIELNPAQNVLKGDANSHQIPLFCAAQSGSAECVRLILGAGVDPNTRDSSGGTALSVAGSADVVRTLLAAGADLCAVDVFGKDALENVLECSCDRRACGLERFEVAKTLVSAGLDIERVDEFGKSRLASAAFSHHADAVEFLLAIGANPHALDPNGATPLHSICWQGEYEDPEINQACERIIRALAAAGVSVNGNDNDRCTPMHRAAGGDWGNPTAIRTLLSLGAAPDAPDCEGDTPLMLASQNGEVDCIELLLNAGADPTHRNLSGKTPFDAADEHFQTWNGIIAQGPDKLLAENQLESKEQFVQEFGVDVEPISLEALLEAQAEQHQASFRNAEKALNILGIAMKKALKKTPDPSSR